MSSKPIRRATAILATLVISAGAVACGSNDGSGDSNGSDTSAQAPLGKYAYIEQIDAAQTRFANDAAKLNLANPPSAKAFGNSLDGLETLIDMLRKRLDAIVAPAEVTAQQDELVRQLAVYGKAIRRQKGALTSSDSQKAAAAAQKVGRASTTFSREFDATIRQINDNLKLETTASPTE